jgi:hypothetical protein
MSGPVLESIALVESAIQRADIVPDESLQTGVDIGTVRGAVRPAGEGRTAVRVKLTFTVRQASGQVVCSIANTFLLVYRGEAPVAPVERRALWVTRGWADAWPTWRAWLHTALASMDMAPSTLPPVPPAEVVAMGDALLAREADSDVEVTGVD